MEPDPQKLLSQQMDRMKETRAPASGTALTDIAVQRVITASLPTSYLTGSALVPETKVEIQRTPSTVQWGLPAKRVTVHSPGPGHASTASMDAAPGRALTRGSVAEFLGMRSRAIGRQACSLITVRPGQVISRRHRGTEQNEKEHRTLTVDSGVQLHQDLKPGLRETVHEATLASKLRQ